MGLWPNASQFDALTLGISCYLPDALIRQRERLVLHRGLKKFHFCAAKIANASAPESILNILKM